MLMKKLKNNVKNYIKRIYYKINPQYKYVLQINDEIYKLNRKIEELEHSKKNMDTTIEINIDKLLLGMDIKNVRYLYLLRYIKENDRVLDIEGDCGTGADLLMKYTPVDSCDCINSIGYYTEIGKMYYSSENVKFYTGNWSNCEKKYNVITFLDENKASCLSGEEIKQLYDQLEFGGILAISLKQEVKMNLFEKSGFKIEKKLYQSQNDIELKENDNNSNVIVAYLKKNE